MFGLDLRIFATEGKQIRYSICQSKKVILKKFLKFFPSFLSAIPVDGVIWEGQSLVWSFSTGRIGFKDFLSQFLFGFSKKERLNPHSSFVYPRKSLSNPIGNFFENPHLWEQSFASRVRPTDGSPKARGSAFGLAARTSVSQLGLRPREILAFGQIFVFCRFF